MQLLEQGSFVRIQYFPDDYKYGIVKKVKAHFGNAPRTRPIEDIKIFEAIEYAPFTKEEIEDGEIEFQCFIKQFKDEPF